MVIKSGVGEMEIGERHLDNIRGYFNYSISGS